MISHVSIPAAQPLQVARALSELLGGEVMRFVPGGPNCYQVYSGKDADRGVFIEVLPETQVFVPPPPERAANPYGQIEGAPPAHHAFHFAMSTDVSPETIAAVCAREGWLSREVWRGPAFYVQEIWVENRLMIELLLPRAQELYAGSMTPEAYRSMMGLELREGVWVVPDEAAA